MKSETQIRTMIKEYERLLDAEENQNETMQIKLWAYIYALKWVLGE